VCVKGGGGKQDWGEAGEEGRGREEGRRSCAYLPSLAAPRRYNIASGGIKLGPQGGHGHVRFTSVEEARRALVALNHSYMGNRYIELFWAS
jgi:hypothetical protein